MELWESASVLESIAALELALAPGLVSRLPLASASALVSQVNRRLRQELALVLGLNLSRPRESA
jgi:hypothetical protein